MFSSIGKVLQYTDNPLPSEYSLPDSRIQDISAITMTIYVDVVPEQMDQIQCLVTRAIYSRLPPTCESLPTPLQE